MFKVIKKEIEIEGKKISLETGKIARQADGAIIATCGETVVLATVVGANVTGAAVTGLLGWRTSLIPDRTNAGDARHESASGRPAAAQFPCPSARRQGVASRLQQATQGFPGSRCAGNDPTAATPKRHRNNRAPGSAHHGRFRPCGNRSPQGARLYCHTCKSAMVTGTQSGSAGRRSTPNGMQTAQTAIQNLSKPDSFIQQKSPDYSGLLHAHSA